MTSPNTPVDVEALEKVARAATQAPWTRSGVRQKWSPGYGRLLDSHSVGPDDGKGWVALIPYDEQNHAEDFGNATFIATFDPPTVLRLLAERREMLEALKRLGSMEPFALENGIWPGPSAEISARIEFARAASSEGKGE